MARGCQAGNGCCKPKADDAEQCAIRASPKPMIKSCPAQDSERSCGGGESSHHRGEGSIAMLRAVASMSGNAGFDVLFIVLEMAVTLLWLVAAVAKGLRRRAWLPKAAFGLAVLGLLVLPAVWNLAYPASSGIEGAGRVLIGVPFVLVQGLLSILWSIFSADDRRSKWSRAWPFVLLVALSLAGWFLV
jgi:hypothetical protein